MIEIIWLVVEVFILTSIGWVARGMWDKYGKEIFNL